MRSSCIREMDGFNLTTYGYKGFAYFDQDNIEAGPRQMAQLLEARQLGLCLEGMFTSEWVTCSADLWKRYGIVLGTSFDPNWNDIGNMNGVYEFLEQTSVKKTLKGGKATGFAFDANYSTEVAEITIPVREVGPGDNETDCEYCPQFWLQRKLESFEVGKILDPSTGQAMSWHDFYTVISKALRRCGRTVGSSTGLESLEHAHIQLARLGRWCDDKPCDAEDEVLREHAQKALHGLREKDSPLPEIRAQMGARNAPRKALAALHNGLQRLPCSIWFSREDAVQHIMPHEYLIAHICSIQCRKAVDDMQNRHGADFDLAARSLPPGNVFDAWTSSREQLDNICMSVPMHTSLLSPKGQAFCAPGFAALGRAEWLFAATPPSNAELLAAIAPALDAFEATLPPYRSQYLELVPRIISESVVNECVRMAFVGDWRRPRIEQVVHDESVDTREYARVIKLFLRLQTSVFRSKGEWKNSDMYWEKAYKEMGLDKYE